MGWVGVGWGVVEVVVCACFNFLVAGNFRIMNRLWKIIIRSNHTEGEYYSLILTKERQLKNKSPSFK